MISIFFLGIILAILVWNYCYRVLWSKNVAVFVQFKEQAVYAGKQAAIVEKVENRKRMPLPVLEVSFHFEKGLLFHDMENMVVSDYTYKRDVFALLGNQRITRTLTLDCNKRGYYSIDKISYTAFSLLYRKRYGKEQPITTDLYVYARRTDVSDIVVVFEKMMGEIQCRKRLEEDMFSFSSIREYTIDDPMKTINWKASAKTGKMMVNTYESTLAGKAMIYLDIEDKGIYSYENLVENGISVAASLAQKLISRGIEVGLSFNAAEEKEAYVKPGASRTQLAKIEKLLAACNTKEGTVSYETILKDLPEDAVPVFITRDVLRNREKIESFLGKENFGIWVIYHQKEDKIEITGQRNLKVIKREVEGR